MNEVLIEWLSEKKKSIQVVCSSYGKVSLFASLIVLIFVISFCVITNLLPKQLKISFLDVGQGDAILIQTPGGHDMLIDGGPNDVVLEKVSDELSYFDRHIDVVLNTHPDADHSTGLIAVLKRYEVGHVIVSPVCGHTGIFEELTKSIKEENAIFHVGKKGDEIIFGDGVKVLVLYPSSPYRGGDADTNDASVSVLVSYGKTSALLTGDLPSLYEGDLITETLPKNITIYKAGHHGSKYSSGERLLSYLHPEYAVISAGKDNRYGHPHREVIERLQKYSKEILQTTEKGTVTFRSDGERVRVFYEH